MDSSTKIVFVLADKLLTNYNAAIAIYNVAQGPKSKRMWVVLLTIENDFTVKCYNLVNQEETSK